MMTAHLTDRPDPRTAGAPVEPTPAPPRIRVDPPRRLDPSPRRDRSWRIALVIVAAVVMTLVLAAMATTSIVGWSIERSYSDVPAVHELGSPSTLTVDSRVADLSVVETDEVDEVTLALVEPGSAGLPPAGAEARARVETRTTAEGMSVEVRQPGSISPVPWETNYRDVLIALPPGHDLDLSIDSDVGNLDVQGDFTALDVTSRVGNVALTSVSATDTVTASSDVGDVRVDLADAVPGGVSVASSAGTVDLRLAEDATGDVMARSDLGDVTVQVPGTLRWSVDAITQLGTSEVDPRVEQASGSEAGRITVTTEMGNISVTR